MRKSLFVFFIPFLLAFAVPALSQEYTSRREVLQEETLRQGFLIQGEYLAKADKTNVGLHLIADGGKTFRAAAYVGGLPGAGWMPGKPRLIGTAEINGEKLKFNITESRDFEKEFASLPFSAAAKVVMERPQINPNGETRQRGTFRGTPIKIEVPDLLQCPALVFEKQNRQSPSLGSKAPEESLVIFDGTNLDQFQENAKMNEFPRGNTLWSEATTKPFEKKPYKLHVEFMLSYMPQAREQGRSNSGVYLDERYECQILDSFGLEGENNECGGFYQIAKPLVNMCFPPLTWQTYDFEFTPAKYERETKISNTRITVKLNGVLIHDNIELPKETPGRAAEGAEPLGLYLQGHGNRVQYRNIWLQYQD